MAIILSNVHPDFDALVAALNSKLVNRDSWKDIYEDSTGQTLVEFMSALATYSQHSIESLFKETFLDTAARATSIYAISRMLGVRISRKLNPSLPVILTRADTLGITTIQRWTSVSVNGQDFVTGEDVFFDVGDNQVSALLYQGVLQEQEFTALGDNSYEQFKLSGAAPFSISDIHVQVLVNNQPWKIIQDGLWLYGPADRIVNDSTFSDGSLMLIFGNDVYGTGPNGGDTITVRYLDTVGGDPIDSIPVNTVIAISGHAEVTGYTSGPVIPGSNQKSHEFYRVMAPHLFTANRRAVTVDDYTAIALTYPGVIDVKVFPQRDIDPLDLRLMNVIQMAVLIEEGGIWEQELEEPGVPLFTFIPGGELNPGPYEYGVVALNDIGSTEMTSVAYNLTQQGSILVWWHTVPGATKYQVYGRVSGNVEYIAEVIPTQVNVDNGYLGYTDDGSIVPTGDPPTENTTQGNWYGFTKWFEKYKHASVRLIQRPAEPQAVDIHLVVYCLDSADDLERIRVQVYLKVRELFEVKQGSIGRLISLSDVICACKIPRLVDTTITDVDYVQIVSPEEDMVPDDIAGFLWLRDLTVDIGYSVRPKRFK